MTSCVWGHVWMRFGMLSAISFITPTPLNEIYLILDFAIKDFLFTTRNTPISIDRNPHAVTTPRNMTSRGNAIKFITTCQYESHMKILQNYNY